MTRQQLAQLATLLDQQASAYIGDRLAYYQPHEGGPDGGQVGFHRSRAKIRAIISGNRFGKTTASVIEAVWLATGKHPYHPIPIPNRGKLYADSYPAVEENLKLKLEEWIPRADLADIKPWIYNNMGQLVGVNFKCGSFLKIGSYDQQTRKSEGSNWSYVGFDEPPDRALYIANLRGLVDLNGLMWFSCTPLSEAWMYDEIYLPGISKEKAYIDIFRGKSDDNPNIDLDGLAIFLDELTEEEKRVRYYGEFATLHGLVIDTFNPILSIMADFPLSEEFVIYEGIDPHPRKPHAALWKAIHQSGVRFVVDELCFEGTMKGFAEALSEKRMVLQSHGAALVKSVADSSLNQKDLGMKVNQLQELKSELKALGEIIMPQIAVKKDQLWPTIQKLRDLYRPVRHDMQKDKDFRKMLQQSEMNAFLGEVFADQKMPLQYVFSNCKRYKHELLHYQWPSDPLDNAKPIAKHNEYIDCDRYIETVAPKYATPGTVFVRTLPPNYMKRENVAETYGRPIRR